MPAKINGNYYIYYAGYYAWSHLEVNGSGGDSDDDSTSDVPVSGVTITPENVTVERGSTISLTTV
jgi:uncharacterized protein YjdB